MIQILLTTRVSRGFLFRAVLGVLPRSFPGVLKMSATFLEPQSECKEATSCEERTSGFERISLPCARSATPAHCELRTRSFRLPLRSTDWQAASQIEPTAQLPLPGGLGS